MSEVTEVSEVSEVHEVSEVSEVGEVRLSKKQLQNKDAPTPQWGVKTLRVPPGAESAADLELRDGKIVALGHSNEVGLILIGCVASVFLLILIGCFTCVLVHYLIVSTENLSFWPHQRKRPTRFLQ
eukprot:GHVN01075399.1.p3 GENE.GHVN01075399.1~~GHVN01075399.1.p3  ORF type:complete len:126 (-),score=41.52 GHVN01075399.1:832-1209(-)